MQNRLAWRPHPAAKFGAEQGKRMFLVSAPGAPKDAMGKREGLVALHLGLAMRDVCPAGDAFVVSLSIYCNGQWQHARSELVKRSDLSVGVVGAVSV
jgi:hypothetical protein